MPLTGRHGDEDGGDGGEDDALLAHGDHGLKVQGEGGVYDNICWLL